MHNYRIGRTFMSCLAGLENPAYCVICIDVGAGLVPALFGQPQGLSLQLGNDLPPCPPATLRLRSGQELAGPVYDVIGRQRVPSAITLGRFARCRPPTILNQNPPSALRIHQKDRLSHEGRAMLQDGTELRKGDIPCVLIPQLYCRLDLRG